MTILERRKQKGISQQAVSVASGIPAYYLTQIESRRMIPSSLQMKRLAEVFGCRPGDLSESKWKIVVANNQRQEVSDD